MVNSMAKALNIHDVATLTSIEGKGFVRHADGTRSELVAGMKLGLGDVVITMPSSKASVQLADGRHVDLARSQGDAIKIDQTVLDVLSDIQDVSVTDLSVIYPLVASQVMTDPTIDPLSFVNDEHSNDLSQTTVMDEREEPAAINDAEGGDLLSGNSYVVLHGNPPVTDATPFVTEPAHFNHDFMPEAIPAFVPNVSPLAFLIAEHAPVDTAPAYVPVISLSMATTLLDSNQGNLIDSSNSTPVVDDEAGFLAYTVHTTNHDDPQHFHVRVFIGDDTVGTLLLDGDSNPLEVNPLDETNNVFYVPVSEGQEGLTIHVKLEPFATEVNYSAQELSSAFVVGEVGSETEVAPASLHLSIATPTYDYAESGNTELIAHYQIKLLDGNNADVRLDHDLTVHWVLQNQGYAGLTIEGDVTFLANHSTAEIVANVPEEDPNNFGQENYTLGLLLDNNVSVTSGGQPLTINPVTVDSSSTYTNLSYDLTISHANQFLVSTNAELSFASDAQTESAEAAVTAQFSTHVNGVLPLEDDADNSPIEFKITSSELPTLVGHSTLTFDVNVYDENSKLVGTLVELNADSDALSFNTLTLNVPLDLTKIHAPGSDLSSTNYVSDADLHGHSLTFKIEAVSPDAVALFSNLDQTYSSVTGFVTDDSAYEQASVKDISVDPLIVDNTQSGVAIFSSYQVLNTSFVEKTVFDEVVKFNVNFDQQFGDATFDVVLHGPNGVVQTVGTITLGQNTAGVITFTNSNGDVVYETLQVSSTNADQSPVDYILNTDGTSSLSFSVALPNTEDSPQYSVSLESTLPAYDLNANVFEHLDTVQATSVPYTLVPDVHVTASIDGLNGATQIDDEAAVSVTISLDHQLAQDTEYHVVIQSTDGLSILYDGLQTVEAHSLSWSFLAGQLDDAFENKDLVITLTDVTTGAVYFDGGSNLDAVKINVINDPNAISVQELVSDPVTITLTAPTLPIDDENPATPDPVFNYHVAGEFLADTALATAQFDVYSQATDATGIPNGSQVFLTTITIDLTQGGPTNFAFDGSFTLPLNLFVDGYQEITLIPQDPTLPTVTSTVFDVVDSNYQLIQDVIGGIETYSLQTILDVSDGTTAPVSGGEGGQGGQGGQGDPLTLQDLITPDSGSNIHLDFGDNAEHQAYVADNSDFGHREYEDSPITHIVFDSDHPGVVSFVGDEDQPVTITPNNVDQAIEFLAQNSRHHEGATVQFNVVNENQTDTYVFHQTADGGYSVANITNIESVAGVDPQLLSPTTIHIDHS